MRLSSLADYAVVMLAAAARRCGASGRLNATLLAAETGLPLPTVQKLVSRLSAAGLVESARGGGGGFRLSRPPATISLADIIEAIEGPIALTACAEHGTRDCAVEDSCRVRPHMGAVNHAVRGALAAVTLSDLAMTTAMPPIYVRGDAETRRTLREAPPSSLRASAPPRELTSNGRAAAGAN